MSVRWGGPTIPRILQPAVLMSMNVELLEHVEKILFAPIDLAAMYASASQATQAILLFGVWTLMSAEVRQLVALASPAKTHPALTTVDVLRALWLTLPNPELASV